MAIFKVPRTILVSQAALKTYYLLDVVVTPPVRRVSSCSSAGWPQGAESAAAWKTGGGGRRRSLSGQAPGSRLPALGSRLPAPAPAPGARRPARSRYPKDAQPRRGGVRTREAVSSDPPAVRSPAEPGSRRDGAAAPGRSPAPCHYRGYGDEGSSPGALRPDPSPEERAI